MRRAAVLAIASLLPLTSGCIAAVIPLVAGAAVVRTQSGSPPSGAAVTTAASASDRNDLKLIPTTLTSLPAPAFAAQPGNPAVAAFASYSARLAGAQPGAGKRESALLTSASGLRPVRADCGGRRPAVLVDLDPGRATFDPLSPGRPDPQLASTLASLRERGVTVVWFSRLGENFAGPARTALAQGELDPEGSDVLVLMRTIDERKQSRRDELAARYCPIAMLGDERADFDELYLYLKQPETALALDAMIGRGWFLASPFSADPRSDAGATP